MVVVSLEHFGSPDGSDPPIHLNVVTPHETSLEAGVGEGGSVVTTSLVASFLAAAAVVLKASALAATGLAVAAAAAATGLTVVAAAAVVLSAAALDAVVDELVHILGGEARK